MHAGWVKTELGTDAAPIEIPEGAKDRLGTGAAGSRRPGGRVLPPRQYPALEPTPAQKCLSTSTSPTSGSAMLNSTSPVNTITKIQSPVRCRRG